MTAIGAASLPPPFECSIPSLGTGGMDAFLVRWGVAFHDAGNRRRALGRVPAAACICLVRDSGELSTHPPGTCATGWAAHNSPDTASRIANTAGMTIAHWNG